MTFRVVFHASASPEIGAGHLIRSGALGRALRDAGAEVLYAVGPQSLSVLPNAYGGDGIRTVDLFEDHAVEANEIGNVFGAADAVVVDDYRLGEGFERACREWAGKVVVISDLPDKKHDADLILDPSGGRVASDYDGRVPAGCAFLLGPSYALLRDLFQDGADRRVAAERVSRVFVTMGATDSDNFSEAVIDAVRKAVPHAAIDVLLAGVAPHLQALRARAEMNDLLTIHSDLAAEEVVRFLDACDLAVGTGGVGLWERCARGVPSITVVVAENQRKNAALADENGASVMLTDGASIRAAETEQLLRSLDGDPALRRLMSERARSLCDGKGATRAAAEILTLLG